MQQRILALPKNLTASLAEALKLTRSGNLSAATQRIQSALGRSRPAAPPPQPIDLTRARVSAPAHTPKTAPPQTPRTAPPPPGKGQFLKARYNGEAGALGYRLYVPVNAKPGMPLLVMLHGCKQTPEDFAAGTAMNRLADEHGCLVAYPGQNRSANAQRCWNWFRPGDQVRDGGEPALIAGLARAVAAEHKADPRRIYVAGLSAGGAAAAVMASAYPDVFAAVGIHSGLACGAAHDVPSALAAMQGASSSKRSASARFVPLINFHGLGDRTVAPSNARSIVDAAAASAGPLKVSHEQARSAGGRQYTRTLHKDRKGEVVIEDWSIEGAPHAWSGGDPSGSYTDPAGPDASREMLRFFLTHQGSA